MNQIDLKQRHAVVTGGAQGIGFAIATRFLQSGASVSLWDRDPEQLKSAQAQLGASGMVTIEEVDVSDAGSVEAAAEGAESKHGRIDILVANAGIAGPTSNCGSTQSMPGSRSWIST
jgi:3-oxoacyl-[acyl-carrier protein] reductase